MSVSMRWIGLPLFLAVAACSGDAEQADLAPPVAEQETAAAAGEPAGPEAGAGQTVMLESLTDQQIAGEATITDLGAQTQVMVRLTGAPPNGSHPGHIHSGSCDAIGGVVQGLQTISTDGTGTGTMTTTLDVAPMQVMDGQHVIIYHGEGGAPATCAPVPMHAM